MSGCASEGPLRAPSLHLPAKVKGLSAERFGNTVELRWTTPARTTDDLPLVAKHGSAAPLAAEICRGVSVGPGPCTPIARIPVESGRPAMYRDNLSGALAAGPPSPLQYRVLVVNNKGKGAEGSTVDTVAGEAPRALRALQAAPTPAGGVRLRWQPAAGAADAITLRVVRGASAKSTLLAVPASKTDPGGADDAGAKFGEQQAYTAYRSRTITLHDQPLAVHSEAAQVTVAANALPPPPPAPTGLEAVVNTLGAPEIDLVWTPLDDVAVGYILTRQAADGPSVQITPQPLRNFSFADIDVKPGVRYRYRVAAVDAHGTIGATSAPVERTIAVP